MVTSNTLRARLLGTSGLAMVAIVGVLSMHGLDPALIGFDHPNHQVAHQETMPAGDGDGLLELCVFAVSFVGLLAVSISEHRFGPTQKPPLAIPLSDRSPSGAVAGRRLLISLGVIRV